jgi:hypothetical protein
MNGVRKTFRAVGSFAKVFLGHERNREPLLPAQ